MNRALVGLVVAALVLVVDQITKEWWLELMRQNPGGIEVTSFFNLVMVWNRGVSFGMFGGGDSDLQRWVLVALALVVSLALVVWLFRGVGLALALALGAVIGGAVGNAVDRVRFGAVADFLDFHVAGWHWPAFNVADAAIVLGVAFLVWDGLFPAAGKR